MTSELSVHASQLNAPRVELLRLQTSYMVCPFLVTGLNKSFKRVALLSEDAASLMTILSGNVPNVDKKSIEEWIHD